MSNEKKIVLQMLKEGKITVEDAEKLLEEQDEIAVETTSVKTTNRKFFRVLVNEANKTKVNINIPIALAEVGLKLIPKNVLHVGDNNINPEDILNLIKEGIDGEFVNIDTIDNGKEVKVKVYIE